MSASRPPPPPYLRRSSTHGGVLRWRRMRRRNAYEGEGAEQCWVQGGGEYTQRRGERRGANESVSGERGRGGSLVDGF